MAENKKGICKFSARFLALSNKISTVQKIVLSSSRGQGNFRGLEASRPRPRTSKCVLEAKDVLEDSTSVRCVLFFLRCGPENRYLLRRSHVGLHFAYLVPFCLDSGLLYLYDFFLNIVFREV